MKIKLLYYMMLLLALTGCNKIKDAATINVPAQLNASIPVVVTAVSGDFSGTADMNLASFEEITPYIEKIKAIRINSLAVTITGLSAGQTINTLTFSVAGVGNIFTQSNITMANNSFTPVIPSAILDQVGSKLTSDQKITISVSGNTNGPMMFTVDLNVATTVIVYVLK